MHRPKPGRGADVRTVTLDDDDFPVPRQRALTLPLPFEVTSSMELGDTPGTRQRTIDQSGSLLLTKLPLELRLRIYHHILGSMLIHVLRRDITKPHVQHVACRAADKQAHWTLRELCWKHDRGTVECTSTHANQSKDSLLALPMTCRQMYGTVSFPGTLLSYMHLLSVSATANRSNSYSETIDILYSANTINIAYYETLPQLQSCICPQRFNRIRSLEVFAPFFLAVPYSRPGGFEERPWEEMWETITAMKGLQNLRVRVEIVLKDHDVSMTGDQEAQLFRPLMALNGLKTFEIDVSWPAGEGEHADAGGAPFQLTRHTERRCTLKPWC